MRRDAVGGESPVREGGSSREGETESREVDTRIVIEDGCGLYFICVIFFRGFSIFGNFCLFCWFVVWPPGPRTSLAYGEPHGSNRLAKAASTSVCEAPTPYLG